MGLLLGEGREEGEGKREEGEGKRARRKGRRGTRPQIFWPRTVPGISKLASHLTDTGKIIGLVDK